MNARLKSVFFLLVCHLVTFWQPTQAAMPKPVSLDPVLDWKAPFSRTREEINALLGVLIVGKEAPFGDPPSVASNGAFLEYLSAQNRDNKEYQVTLFNGAFTVSDFYVTFADGVPVDYWINLPGSGSLPAYGEKVRAVLSEVLQMQPQQNPPEAMETGSDTSHTWATEQFQVTCIVSEYRVSIWIKGITGTEGPRKVATDLDPLLNVAELWTWTPEILEKKFRMKKEVAMKQPPQFEWLNADKSRARFSRKMFSNIITDLHIFGQRVPVDEATLEFVNGRVARVTLSLYNFGDSGEINIKDFENRFVTTGKNLGGLLKVAPRNVSVSGNSAVKTVSWLWQSASGIAMLEYNDFASSGTRGLPKFLRLKLAAPDQADWSMGKLSVGVQRMALVKNITKTPSGDVYLAGVPMVDQGAKGYCVAASCQRLFEYMQIPCDQHEIAQLVQVDATEGADIFSMQKSLAKIDGKYNVTFKPHINPELYYSSNRNRRVSQKQFLGIVKEHVAKGVPLLWALQLGRYPEEPPLPGDGQMSGGHMRMVIGYNENRGEILFSDSWGAGHELKRMGQDAAYLVTLGLYSMSPRGL